MDNKDLIKLKSLTSPTFCMAKFHEATIWLYNSKMAACHHTPLFPTGTTLETFFNNRPKREQQKKMIIGQKPKECNYCWKLEDKNLVSDRQLKSLAMNNPLSADTYLDESYVFKPKALEIAFQNKCNLACSYCSPTFSTEWIKDITSNGMYENITTDMKMHYSRGLDNNEPVDFNLFWTWFESVASELESIRITGGEPLLHEETFQTFNLMKTINPNVEFVIHTNLCQKTKVIDRFVENISNFEKFRINISNESAGEIAEFIRDGMDYQSWLTNVQTLASNTHAILSISTTITALALINLDLLYRDIINLRKQINIKSKPYISINIATYPVFQSLSCLTKQERIFYKNKFENFFKEIENDLLDLEKSSIPRLISMLDPELTDENNENYRKDCLNFFDQYTIRRNKKHNIVNLLGKK